MSSSDYSRIRGHWPIVIKYHKDNPELSNKALAEKIIDNERLSYAISHFRLVVGACRTALNEGVIDETFTTQQKIKPKWEVKDGLYLIHAKKGDIALPVSDIDNLFYEHSKHGLDYTSTKVMNMHSMKPWEWYAIKTALDLYKESNIFSPWTEENTPDDEYEDMVRQKMSMKFDDKQRFIEQKYDQAQRRSLNKTIEAHHKRVLTYEKMIEEVFDTVERIPELKVVKTTSETADGEVPEIVVTVADLHIGARVRDLIATRDFDTDTVRRRLDQIATKVNKIESKGVHLAFLGDLIESFTGLTHVNSWKGLEYGMYGAKCIKETIDVLIEFIGKVNNIKGMYCVGGNHDRVTSSWREDDMGDVAATVWDMIKRLYGDQFDVEFNPLVITKSVAGVNYLLTHGDKKAVTRNPSHFILEYGRQDMFNVLLSGHLHTRMIPEDNHRYRWVLSPSVFSGNWYSEKNGWTATPGFMVLTNDSGMGVPTVVDYPLL